ncbi:dihydroorotate dehydrogenase electron transfer subunit [Candidatus Neomarinimicrobiota bacterium]
MYIEVTKVIANGPLAKDIYQLELESEQISPAARPGQFVNILIGPTAQPLLRRPMSVAFVHGTRLGLIYKLFGEGTRTMSSWTPGTEVDILGPLGNGWTVAESSIPVLIGGGVGIAPINFLHEELVNIEREHFLIMGARTAAEHFLEHNPAAGIILTTDDGSLGLAGTVQAGLDRLLQTTSGSSITIYTCGPPVMLAAMQSSALEGNIRCQLAVEEMMGCGFGICQGCCVQTRDNGQAAADTYHIKFKLACIDGPVFWANEIADLHE